MTVPGEPTETNPFVVGPTGSGSWPSAPSLPARAKRPGPAGYWIGALLAVACVVVSVVWLSVTVFGILREVESYPRFSAPGELVVHLDPGTYKVFAEYPGAATDFGSPDWLEVLDVTGPHGRYLAMHSGPNENYNWNGREGRAVAAFTVDVAGSYRVHAGWPLMATPGTVQIAVGKGITWSAVAVLLAAIGVGGMGVLAALIIIVVTVIRRSRAGTAPSGAAPPTFAPIYQPPQPYLFPPPPPPPPPRPGPDAGDDAPPPSPWSPPDHR